MTWKEKKNWYLFAKCSKPKHTYAYKSTPPNLNHYHLKKIPQPTLKFAWIFILKLNLPKLTDLLVAKRGNQPFLNTIIQKKITIKTIQWQYVKTINRHGHHRLSRSFKLLLFQALQSCERECRFIFSKLKKDEKDQDKMSFKFCTYS